MPKTPPSGAGQSNEGIIKSRQNKSFKMLLSLLSQKGIKSSGMFLVGGEKVIAEILTGQKEHVLLWIRTPKLSMPPALIRHTKIITLSGELFRELNTAGTSGPLLGLRLPQIPPFSAASPWPAGCTLFIPFGDPENVGAVIRSATGLGASRVVLLREAALPFLPRAVRSSAGAILRIRMEYGPSINEMAALSLKMPVFALDRRGKPLDEIEWPQSFGLIAGMEGKGLPREIINQYIPVSIPLHGGIESLNATAAVSIALWAWRNKRPRGSNF
jgi:16S rRNA (guanine527-N7)-methyltransferase